MEPHSQDKEQPALTVPFFWTFFGIYKMTEKVEFLLQHIM
jgi:hypothetical protein